MKTIDTVKNLDTVITPGWLKSYSACGDGYAWACTIIGDGMTLEKFLPKFERADWMLWTLKRAKSLEKIHLVKIAIKCAESVIEIYERKYPKDDRPRKSIEAAIAYAKDPTEANRNASAASAASAAASYAAASAASAAAASYASYAADAASYAAYAAYAAASAAASYAAASAASAADAASYASYAAASAAASASAADAARKVHHKKLCAITLNELGMIQEKANE